MAASARTLFPLYNLQVLKLNVTYNGDERKGHTYERERCQSSEKGDRETRESTLLLLCVHLADLIKYCLNQTGPKENFCNFVTCFRVFFKP